MDLLYLINLSGKYSKQALFRLEKVGLNNPDVRKIVLDAFNDYRREMLREINDTQDDSFPVDKVKPRRII